MRRFDYSKDGEAHRVRVVLALAVRANGLPFEYELSPGHQAERPILKTFVERMKDEYAVTELVDQGKVTVTAECWMGLPGSEMSFARAASVLRAVTG